VATHETNEIRTGADRQLRRVAWTVNHYLNKHSDRYIDHDQSSIIPHAEISPDNDGKTSSILMDMSLDQLSPTIKTFIEEHSDKIDSPRLQKAIFKGVSNDKIPEDWSIENEFDEKGHASSRLLRAVLPLYFCSEYGHPLDATFHSLRKHDASYRTSQGTELEGAFVRIVLHSKLTSQDALRAINSEYDITLKRAPYERGLDGYEVKGQLGIFAQVMGIVSGGKMNDPLKAISSGLSLLANFFITWQGANKRYVDPALQELHIETVIENNLELKEIVIAKEVSNGSSKINQFAKAILAAPDHPSKMPKDIADEQAWKQQNNHAWKSWFEKWFSEDQKSKVWGTEAKSDLATIMEAVGKVREEVQHSIHDKASLSSSKELGTMGQALQQSNKFLSENAAKVSDGIKFFSQAFMFAAGRKKKNFGNMMRGAISMVAKVFSLSAISNVPDDIQEKYKELKREKIKEAREARANELLEQKEHGEISEKEYERELSKLKEASKSEDSDIAKNIHSILEKQGPKKSIWQAMRNTFFPAFTPYLNPSVLEEYGLYKEAGAGPIDAMRMVGGQIAGALEMLANYFLFYGSFPVEYDDFCNKAIGVASEIGGKDWSKESSKRLSQGLELMLKGQGEWSAGLSQEETTFLRQFNTTNLKDMVHIKITADALEGVHIPMAELPMLADALNKKRGTKEGWEEGLSEMQVATIQALKNFKPDRTFDSYQFMMASSIHAGRAAQQMESSGKEQLDLSKAYDDVAKVICADSRCKNEELVVDLITEHAHNIYDKTTRFDKQQGLSFHDVYSQLQETVRQRQNIDPKFDQLPEAALLETDTQQAQQHAMVAINN
jgi:uncharacterized membrane protein